MPFSRHYVPELRLALTRAFGTITDEDVESHLKALNTEHADGEALLELERPI